MLENIILGAIQGLTEFLPISSSGHLLLTSRVLNIELPIAFEILLHIATLGAVCVYTFPTILAILRALYKMILSTMLGRNIYSDTHSAEYTHDKMHVDIVFKLIISTFATIPIALLLKDLVTTLDTRYIGFAMLFTALWLSLPFASSRMRTRIHRDTRSRSNMSSPDYSPDHSLARSLTRSIGRSLATPHTLVIPHITWLHALLLGLFQGIAVLPGISRSGLTISLCVILGYSYAHATRYSFLMSIPAILASFVFSISELPALLDTINIGTLIASMITAFAFGILGLAGLSIIATRGRIWIFSLYLLLVGSSAIILSL